MSTLGWLAVLYGVACVFTFLGFVLGAGAARSKSLDEDIERVTRAGPSVVLGSHRPRAGARR